MGGRISAFAKATADFYFKAVGLEIKKKGGWDRPWVTTNSLNPTDKQQLPQSIVTYGLCTLNTFRPQLLVSQVLLLR